MCVCARPKRTGSDGLHTHHIAIQLQLVVGIQDAAETWIPLLISSLAKMERAETRAVLEKFRRAPGDTELVLAERYAEGTQIRAWGLGFRLWGLGYRA